MLVSMLKLTVVGLLTVIAAVLFSGSSAFAADPPSDFSLQISPSVLYTSVKPGTVADTTLQIRNNGTGTESLKIQPRKFSIDNATGKVTINDTEASEIADWVHFSAPTFSIEPGQVVTEKIHIAVPKDTGFSYSLVLVISRTNNQQTVQSGRLLNGSVAVFTLINIDRPGAKRQLEIEDFSSTANVYEYLPATLNMTFKNTGNTIAQPFGNIFIQQGSGVTPLATLPVNGGGGYILPGSSRVVSADWQDGFPVYQVTGQDTGSAKKTEVWDWSKVSKLRIGSYTAKLVAVYNDGQRDVPLQREVTFWVIPWKIIAIALVIFLFVCLGVWTIIRWFLRLLRRGKPKAPSDHA